MARMVSRMIALKDSNARAAVARFEVFIRTSGRPNEGRDPVKRFRSLPLSESQGRRKLPIIRLPGHAIFTNGGIGFGRSCMRLPQ